MVITIRHCYRNYDNKYRRDDIIKRSMIPNNDIGTLTTNSIYII